MFLDLNKVEIVPLDTWVVLDAIANV
jgi:hypothetical protein